jgi:hypothetical protein
MFLGVTMVIHRFAYDMLMLEFKCDISEPGWDDTTLQILSVVIIAKIIHIQLSIYMNQEVDCRIRLYSPRLCTPHWPWFGIWNHCDAPIFFVHFLKHSQRKLVTFCRLASPLSTFNTIQILCFWTLSIILFLFKNTFQRLDSVSVFL